MVGGFHSAMALGPLCDEPMQSIGIVLEEFILENKEIDGKIGTPENDETTKEIIVMDDAELGENDEKEEQEDQRLHSNAQLHGQLISAFRQVLQNRNYSFVDINFLDLSCRIEKTHWRSSIAGGNVPMSSSNTGTGIGQSSSCFGTKKSKSGFIGGIILKSLIQFKFNYRNNNNLGPQ